MNSPWVRFAGVLLAVAVALYGVIWLVAAVFGLPIDGRGGGHSQHRKSVLCHKDQEIVLATKKVCTYVCENGEKSRVEGVDRCFKTIEVD